MSQDSQELESQVVAVGLMISPVTDQAQVLRELFNFSRKQKCNHRLGEMRWQCGDQSGGVT